MPITTIVAIPSKDDHVWDISSEKIPHMTLLQLGDQSANPNLQKMIDYVEHVAEVSLPRFGVSVDYRGPFGPNEADVLFFRKWGLDRVTAARAYLLADDNIKIAYDSVDQYEPWTPHLTLGYPATPAHKETRDYPISWVNFDKLAIWTGDFSGEEFPLTEQSDWELAYSDLLHDKVTADQRRQWAKEGIAMPDGSYYIRNATDLKNAISTVGLGNASNAAIRRHIIKRAKALGLESKLPDGWLSTGATKHGEDLVEGILEHHGVKGMKWGVHRSRSARAADVTVTQRGKRLRTTGGYGHRPSLDATKAASSKRKARSSGVHSLSNEELQHLVNRLNLEQQYSRLNKTPAKAGKQFVTKQLAEIGKQHAAKLIAKSALKVGAAVVA